MCNERCGVCGVCKAVLRNLYFDEVDVEHNKKRRAKDKIKAARRRKYENLGM